MRAAISGFSKCHHLLAHFKGQSLIYHTVKNIGGEKTLANLAVTAFCQVFLPIFTISETFPMQMDFYLPKFFLPNFLQPLFTNFFTAKVFYCMIFIKQFETFCSNLTCCLAGKWSGKLYIARLR